MDHGHDSTTWLMVVMSDHCFAKELSDNVAFGYQQSLNIQLQDPNR